MTVDELADTSLTVDSSRLHGIMTAYLQSKAVFVGLKLGVFEALHTSPATAAELTGQLRLEARPTRALLTALQGLGLVTQVDDVYRNSVEAELFLTEESPWYMGQFAEQQDTHFGNFAGLADAVRTNTSITGRVVADGYVNQGATAVEGREGAARPLQAMRVSSRMQAASLAEALPVADVKRVVDLGCGSGDYSIAVARRHPQVRLTSLDSPAVVDLARANVMDAGLDDRVRCVPANIFRDPIPNTDAILLSHVLDGYGPEQARFLVVRAYDALPSGGQLFVHAHVPSLATSVFPYLFGLILVANTAAGEVRDVDELVAFFEDAGFRDIQTHPVSTLSGLLTARKR